MYYKTHIRFVNTHTKSNRCHDDIDSLHQKGILVGTALRAVHASMVWQCFDVVDNQCLCQLFHFFSAQAIYYARFALMTFYEFYDVLVNVLGLRTHFII